MELDDHWEQGAMGRDVVFADEAWSLRFGCQPGRRPEWSLVEDGRLLASFGLPEMTYADLMRQISPLAPLPVARRLAGDAVATLGESPRRHRPDRGAPERGVGGT